MEAQLDLMSVELFELYDRLLEISNYLNSNNVFSNLSLDSFAMLYENLLKTSNYLNVNGDLIKFIKNIKSTNPMETNSIETNPMILQNEYLLKIEFIDKID